MAPWHNVRRTLTCTLLFLSVSPVVFAQPSTSGGVEAGATFGAGSVDGVQAGVPPSGNPLFGAARLSIGVPVRGIRVSGETEVTFSGDTTGKQLLGGPPFFTYRERRREVLWSVLAGAEVWEPHRVGSLHVVGGMSHVNPIVTAATQPCCSGAWRDADAPYRSTWAATLGIDLRARFGRILVGPGFRWHGYLENPSPHEIGHPSRASFLGITASYHF